MARRGQLSGPPIRLDNAPQGEATVFASVWWLAPATVLMFAWRHRRSLLAHGCWPPRLVGAASSITVLLSLCGVVPYVRSVVLSQR